MFDTYIVLKLIKELKILSNTSNEVTDYVSNCLKSSHLLTF